ncbi:4'-phosphopantetheinyl transferase [Nonomuraea coxensis DSM 45129]|uniref:4'-phosphopantetheinyl transferase n=1 Tax=Nonomuraea coxensis DSM 45129 TaxID=1122611 RepID=A0ABX8U7R0_9ACTN|nr:4'-phosphopantetheinyl transferase superfamily protein [Nonomuraea coxensis]QYC42702.1 4'-phosphopantetheinyl transferase [Nonomuraea coxensis DSM 45129]
MSAVLVSAVLVGVDIVESDRLARAAARGGTILTRRLTTPAERDRGPGPAAFSVKESLIKAVGLRPPGFTWHDFEALAAPPRGWAGRLMEEAAGELAASTGVRLSTGASYAVRGASARAARERLGPGTAAGAARWGEGGGLFVSLAIVYVEQALGEERSAS